MELRQIRYFVAVAEELHFRKAAEKLHIVQPALSKQVSALEAELGVQLLERDRRHVVLTEAGQVFLDEANSILAQADGARARARAVSTGRTGFLNIGFIQPALADPLPRALRAFRAEYPDVVVRLSMVTNQQAVESIANRTMHLAFARMPIPTRPEIQQEVVLEQDVDLLVPEGHPLAEKEEIFITDIAGTDFIVIDRAVESTLHDYYIALCNEAGFSPRIAHEVNSTWVAIGLVAAGLGVAFAPASAKTAPQKGVVYRKVSGEPPRLSIGLIWNRELKPAVVENFLAMRAWERRETPLPQRPSLGAL